MEKAVFLSFGKDFAKIFVHFAHNLFSEKVV